MFAGRGGDDRDAPHNFANRRASRDVARALGIAPPDAAAWRAIPEDRIRDGAARVLAESSQALMKLGPSAKRFLHQPVP